MLSAGTFRDPAGQLFERDGRILRLVRPESAPFVRQLLDSRVHGELVTRGMLVGSKLLADDVRVIDASAPAGSLLLEHERIPFPAYPYEWTPEMLRAAGELTLELAERLLEHGMGLKDATPLNVLFRGPTPVFVDVLSIERRDPSDPTWLPYAQFLRAFVLPLLANDRFGIPLSQVFQTRRDGLEPEDLYAMCGPLRRLAPPFLGLVALPTWLGRSASEAGGAQPKPTKAEDPERARFVLRFLLRGLRRRLAKADGRRAQRSHWADYMSSKSYEQADFAAKEAFVRDALTAGLPRAVLDVGCNTGHFSAIAAEQGARVVAIDSDPAVVGRTWSMARERKLDLLPLHVDLSRPTPATGWRYREGASFLSRASGGFDLVLMLAVLHHLLVSEMIPLGEVLDLAAELTRKDLVLEFVPPDDPMFRRLARGRDALFAGLDRASFEAACAVRFEIVRAQTGQASTRIQYLLRKRTADTASA